MNIMIKVLQGTLIGIGAVLPGISGGVLCVVFGIYRTVMELLADPFGKLKTNIPQLLPVIIGGIIGFLGIANVLSVLLDKYPDQSVCVFVGLIFGMLPALFKEAGEKGRNRNSVISLIVSMIVIFAILIGLKLLTVSINEGFMWYMFCGVSLALSVIAPGLSFSTLLMPLGLYEPFVAGIGHMNMNVIIPAGIGAVVTVVCFAKAINKLFERYYSVTFHGIIGVVIAATVMIIPFNSFLSSGKEFCLNAAWLGCGVLLAMCLEEFNNNHQIAK